MDPNRRTELRKTFFLIPEATAFGDVDNYGSFAFDWIDTNSDGNITRAEFDVVANLVEEMLSNANFDSIGTFDCNGNFLNLYFNCKYC